MIHLALYKGRGDWLNGAIRWRTSSPYSHCELVAFGNGYSSSGRDRGVRVKRIEFDADRWDIFESEASYDRLVEVFRATAGMPYDYWGAIVGRGIDAKVEDRQKWFCSEWCAHALGFAEPWRYTPALLASVLSRRTRTKDGSL